jgi:hypothetical protein
MRRQLSGLWIVISRPPGDEEFDSTSGRFEAQYLFRSGYLHPELLQLLNR